MPLFPPGVPVAVIVDGRPLAAYQRSYLAEGRVFVPVSPLLTRLADRLWVEGNTLVVERYGRRIRVLLSTNGLGEFNDAYVPAGPVLRSLGASVRYDPAARRLLVTIPVRGPLESPTPFNPALASAAPSAVFTPPVSPTPRPQWTGSPLPRRTALPLPPP
ncbi:MAG: hypothetical protein WB609_05495 [Candidatus Cybelea sp.]